MAYILVRHKVNDYNKWKPVFDEHGAVRKTIGSKGGYLFRNIDDPNEVVMCIEADDVEKAREFVKSEDLRQTMERSGVVDQPDIFFLDLVERPSA
jgi:hypothetical protein